MKIHFRLVKGHQVLLPPLITSSKSWSLFVSNENSQKEEGVSINLLLDSLRSHRHLYKCKRQRGLQLIDVLYVYFLVGFPLLSLFFARWILSGQSRFVSSALDERFSDVNKGSIRDFCLLFKTFQFLFFCKFWITYTWTPSSDFKIRL